MNEPLHAIQRQALLGWAPRDAVDVAPDAIPVDDTVLDEARELVSMTARWGDEVADRVERACHELSCIEDSGLSGTFRRLIAVAIVAHWLKDEFDRRADGGWPLVVAVHRAVEERWVGSTYDLSNCLACLQHLPVTGHDPQEALGTWIWLNLSAGEHSSQFRWTMSTRRFEPGLGREIVARSRARLERGTPDSEPQEVTPEQAEGIARDYVRAHPELGLSGAVRAVVRGTDLAGQWPNVYGKDDEFWERQWVIYLEQPQPPGGNAFIIRSSMIVAVDRFTGEVGYAGSANNEG